MEEKIVTVLNEMSEYLSIAQMKKLQEVILKNFAENEVEKTNITNDEFLQMFLAAKRVEGCSDRTIQYYRVTINHLFSQIGTEVRKISTEEIRIYLAKYQRRNNCSNVTFDNVRRNISSFFSWLEEEDYILKSPMKRIHKIKTKTVVKNTISDEGIEKLRDNCREIRDLAIIDLLYSTGIRVGELVNLNIDDIDLEGRECVVYGKGDKERRVYFDAKAKVHLKKYIDARSDNNSALFVTLDAPYARLKISGVEIRLRQLGRRLNIERVHPHKFRRTMATKQMVEECNKQVRALNTDLVSVKLKREFVERYSKIENFTYISEGAKGELITHIAPLVYMDEQDEYAKRFDNFMYGLMIAHIESMPSFKFAKKQLCDIAAAFERKIAIPQIKAKLPVIKEINSDPYWAANDIMLFEKTRRELRELIKFLVEDVGPRKPIITKLTDPIIDTKEGQKLDPAYDFEDYKKKVDRYVNEHGNSVVIHKLTHNIPLTSGDYAELERVLTEELGSKEDYVREFGDTPFGLLIRKIAKLDHNAAMEAFSSFINDASLNQKQIAFVHKIINHIEQNGYMEDIRELMKPPFDKPISFVKLFDTKTRTALMQKINEIKENAINVVA